MAKRSLSRREFLKMSAVGAASIGMGACASLDRYFMGDFSNLQNEVVILGAGAAGLAAAFELKKRKVPFRVFEASSRVGGRVQTVQMFTDGGPVAELGAEFFELSHTHVHQLAKELNLPVQEIKTLPDLEAHLFYFDKKNYRVKDILPKIKTLQNPLRRVRTDLFRDQDVVLNYKSSVQFERSQYYDSLSLQDLLDSWRNEVDPLILDLLKTQAIVRFGVEPQEQSALHFLETLDGEGSSLLSGRTQFRLEGGLSRLMQTMADRVAGVLPQQIVKMNSALTEIVAKDDVFELTFSTPKGSATYTAKHIICTLPFSKLRQVKGIENLQFSAVKKENILAQAYASHSKGALGFASPFWRQRYEGTPANLGNFTGDFKSQKIWDASRGQSTSQGVLTFQNGGKAGIAVNASFAQDLERDLELFYKEIPSADKDTQAFVNWQKRPWTLGSMAYFRPGQYMKFKGIAAEPEYGGRFQFAGEHTSLRFAGTLQGALESGQRAASEIISLISVPS